MQFVLANPMKVSSVNYTPVRMSGESSTNIDYSAQYQQNFEKLIKTLEENPLDVESRELLQGLTYQYLLLKAEKIEYNDSWVDEVHKWVKASPQGVAQWFQNQLTVKYWYSNTRQIELAEIKKRLDTWKTTTDGFLPPQIVQAKRQKAIAYFQNSARFCQERLAQKTTIANSTVQQDTASSSTATAVKMAKMPVQEVQDNPLADMKTREVPYTRGIVQILVNGSEEDQLALLMLYQKNIPEKYASYSSPLDITQLPETIARELITSAKTIDDVKLLDLFFGYEKEKPLCLDYKEKLQALNLKNDKIWENLQSIYLNGLKIGINQNKENIIKPTSDRTKALLATTKNKVKNFNKLRNNVDALTEQLVELVMDVPKIDQALQSLFKGTYKAPMQTQNTRPTA